LQNLFSIQYVYYIELIHTTMKTNYIILIFFCSFFFFSSASGQISHVSDTTIVFTPSDPNLIRAQAYKPSVHAWGVDLLLSNNGFGLGAFYRYEMTDELSLMINLAISDVKDDA
jgi:hypothetical protein